MTATDKRYGRRGGRWTNPPQADDAMALMDKLRAEAADQALEFETPELFPEVNR